jgi:hypothetical protein
MSQHDDETRILKIRTLNDEFRRTFEGGRILFTPGVMELPVRLHKPLAGQIMTYTEFNESNDPYHEHDFGALTLDGQKIFWKIDYYDRECCEGSPDPSDPDVTTRVMTIMLASEY